MIEIKLDDLAESSFLRYGRPSLLQLQGSIEKEGAVTFLVGRLVKYLDS